MKAVGALKVVTVSLVLVYAAIIVADPTVKVALIMGGTAVITTMIGSGTAFILRRMDRKQLQGIQSGVSEMKVSIDGKLDQFIETTKSLSHAEGRREGVESQRQKEK
jgi:hypothetical protein